MDTFNIFDHIRGLLHAAELMPGFTSARGIFCCIAWLASLLAIIVVVVSFISDFGNGGDSGGDTPDGETGPFSLRVVIGFLLGLGWGGYISVQNGLSTGGAIGVGLLVGVALAAVMAGVIRIMYGLKSDGTLRYEDLVGKQGIVYVSIPPRGEPGGQVQIPHPAQYVTMPAIQHGDVPLPAQTTVVVTQAASTHLTVEPLKSSSTQ